ncbi:hypothetical protein A2U01_0082676, partial [Trifolium medium]|nr:hypothetical protein [Trifolium medium]
MNDVRGMDRGSTSGAGAFGLMPMSYESFFWRVYRGARGAVWFGLSIKIILT